MFLDMALLFLMTEFVEIRGRQVSDTLRFFLFSDCKFMVWFLHYLCFKRPLARSQKKMALIL